MGRTAQRRRTHAEGEAVKTSISPRPSHSSRCLSSSRSPSCSRTGTFDVGPQGAIERLNVHGPARGALAAVAHPVRAVVFDENDVIAGALALMQKLSMYTTRAIKRFEQ